MGLKAIDRIYNSLMGTEEYGDLPETKDARKKLKAYVMGNIFSADDEEAHEQWMGLEGILSEYAMVNERQGFLFGFRYAVELLTVDRTCNVESRLDENIRNEYSTLAVERCDRLEPVVDILRHYVPKEEFNAAMDEFCACTEDTKYAVFEQGFLRGIAAGKGGAI